MRRRALVYAHPKSAAIAVTVEAVEREKKMSLHVLASSNGFMQGGSNRSLISEQLVVKLNRCETAPDGQETRANMPS